ncbi:MAG: DNRLRE domain-containing protein [Niastella sp.]|jgi:hypothetical protein|uniref:DNRLRE domain-containing protein n=1 Tax=Niastella sp. TaxID=1869183 RepID=UPI00389A64A6
MKSYPILNMPVILAITLPLIIISCKKDVKSAPPAEKAAHKTIVLRAEPTTETAANIELNVGVLNRNTNWSANPAQELDCLAWTVSGDPTVLRPLMRFSALPCCGSSTPPTSAYLTLFSHPAPGNGDRVHANYGTNNAFYIRRVTSPWSWKTDSTTWFNQPPTTTAGQVLIPHTNAQFLDLIHIDVTQIIRDIYINGNYGIMMQLQNENYYNSRIFCHSAYPDVNKRPYLTIVF